MEQYIINGGRPLMGSLEIHGAKNSALPVMAACLLSKGNSRIANIPRLSDVYTMAKIFAAVGGESELTDNVLTVNCSSISSGDVPDFLMRKMRSSFIVVGALLSRQGYARVTHPGGCEIGTRAIDLHIKGLISLGAKIQENGGHLIFTTTEGLKGASIYLDYPSVGATENIMMSAVTAKGTTLVNNAAREPEIVDLQLFLNKMGANVSGAGTDQIRIEGVDQLREASHSIIPDRIVAGTLMVAAAVTAGDVTLTGVVPEHLTVVTAKLHEMGAKVYYKGDSVRVRGIGRLKAVDRIRTAPHPGFPTDMQPQFMAALSVAEGISIINEKVFDGRFKHVDELRRMGAQISIDQNSAIIKGVPRLSGARVEATDLRAGAALVIAGLRASGTTIVEQIEHIDRGYVALEKQLTALGADIKRVKGANG